jgi:hypothetical protein
LRENEVKGNKSFEFLGEVNPLWKAKQRKQSLVDGVLLWIFFEENRFKSLLK